MSSVQGAPSKYACSLLAVICGKFKDRQEDVKRYPFPELASSGRLEVQTLINPTIDEFRQVMESLKPNMVYLLGEQLVNEEGIGSLVWGGVDLSTPEAISGIFNSTLPTTVYLEIPDGGNLAETIHSKGVPYVIYWKDSLSCYAACHFREALMAVVQSSCSHTWDVFQLAHASFTLYCLKNNEKGNGKTGPSLLGEPPKINITPVEKDAGGGGGGEEEDSSGNLPAVKIHDDDVSTRFLVCGVPCTLDAFLLGSLEDGLNALLSIEIRGSKLHNRVSAPPPPLQAGGFSRGVVTMRCDLSTSSSAHISLLVSGSAQTCFDDELLESHIKNELIEKSQLVHALPSCEESKRSSSEPWQSASIACGATVFEVWMKVPTWASQVLKQLAPQVFYRSFVALGIACIQGSSVASFEKDDAERLLFFSNRLGKDLHPLDAIPSSLPSWLKVPAPSRKRSEPCQETKPVLVGENGSGVGNVDGHSDKEIRSIDRSNTPLSPRRQKLKVAAMRPIPHSRRHKMLPFLRPAEEDWYDGSLGKINSISLPPAKPHVAGTTPASHRKLSANSFQAKQIISLNPLPLKKHGCDRSPIQVCSEEEFLRDVMQFLVLRGHTRLIPQGGLAEFPDAILNAKRLDLFNLYREVVSRGGFHVGNGINWKGQVFSKMRNHTMTNRMTDYAKTDGLEYICPQCSITNFRRKPQKPANGYS
ncbi:hypothetical protein IFM89_028615 [Coptis chinensis]|uniref:ARID domain-containing protein n=1 Tax=Coptis chinensis TaxID=261450 RepID=A0A835M719_9MAGN|nr:hypothetical protein IFM89_028615 [Coptis chinensis]